MNSLVAILTTMRRELGLSETRQSLFAELKAESRFSCPAG